MIIAKAELDELSAKMLEGTRLAIKKLVEETAARGGELVIGDDDGGFKTVPAKELLPIVQEEGYLEP